MLLDALTYIINADNKKLNDEVAKSEKRVDEFTDSMTEAEKQADELEKKIRAGFKTIGVSILAAVSVSKLLSSALDYAEEASNLQTVADTLGIAIEDVDALGRSVERLGGTSQGAQDALRGLGQYVGQALRDGSSGAAKSFSEMGIRLRDAQGQARSTIDVMRDLAEVISGMERPRAIEVLQEAGISDQKTIELMLRGRQEMENLLRVQKESGVITKEQAEQARKFTEAMARYRQATRNSADSISRMFLPALTSLLNRFTSIVEWMNEHKTFVQGFFIAIGTVLTAMYLPAVIKAAVATWALIAPYAAVVAVIAAVSAGFALLYDDIMHFLEGHDSLIGRISEDYPAVGEIVKYFANNVRAIFRLLTGDFEGAKEAFSESAQAISNVFGIVKDSVVESFNQLLSTLLGGPEAAERVKDGMVSAFNVLDSVVRGIFNGLKAFIDGIWKWISGIYDKSVGMVGKISGWLGFGDDTPDAPYGSAVPSVPPSLMEANRQLSQIDSNPLNPLTSQSITNSSNARSETNIQVGEVNIQTQATDASGIAGDIKNELRNQLADAQNEAASGVDR